MAFPWLMVAAGAQLAGGIFGSKASGDAANQAIDLSRANAWYIQQETNEQKRRLEFEQGRTRASARLRAAGSGFRSGKKSMGASSKAFLSTLKDVQQSELDWITTSGKSRADIALRGGQSQASQLRAQGTAQLIGGAAGAASTLYKGLG